MTLSPYSRLCRVESSVMSDFLFIDGSRIMADRVLLSVVGCVMGAAYCCAPVLVHRTEPSVCSVIE